LTLWSLIDPSGEERQDWSTTLSPIHTYL